MDGDNAAFSQRSHKGDRQQLINIKQFSEETSSTNDIDPESDYFLIVITLITSLAIFTFSIFFRTGVNHAFAERKF
uniref:Uncharacterized protein n=1 Tax=Arion vulgaris TaxID=1028688 RepID=A0A0B7AWX7_9EUPU